MENTAFRDPVQIRKLWIGGLAVLFQNPGIDFLRILCAIPKHVSSDRWGIAANVAP